MNYQLQRNEMIRALVVAIQKVHKDKHIQVHEDHLTGSNRWVVTVDGLGHFDADFACDVLAQIRAAKGLDEKTVPELVQELLDCSKAASTAPKLGPANLSLAPETAPAAPAPAAPAPSIDYDKLAAALASKLQPAAAAPAAPAAPGKI